MKIEDIIAWLAKFDPSQLKKYRKKVKNINIEALQNTTLKIFRSTKKKLSKKCEENVEAWKT